MYGAHCVSRGTGSIPEKGHFRILAMSSAFVPDFVKPFLAHISTNSAFFMPLRSFSVSFSSLGLEASLIASVGESSC